MEELKKHIRSFFPFAQKRMGFDRPPKLFLKQDGANAKNTLGKTAYYDPSAMSITLFTMERHPKDILRSLSHELVHHTQNCRGDFEGGLASEDGYAQTDPHLREMEREAYEQGNLCFRDWEDSIKYGGGEQTMALNERKLREAIRGALKKIMEDGNAGLPGLDDAESDEAAEESAEKGEEEGEQFGTTKEGQKYHRDDKEDDDLEEAIKGWGGNKGDKSKTHKGEKDYTTKKDDEKKTTSPGRGEKKGDKAYVNEEEDETLDESPSHPADDRNQDRKQGRRVKDTKTGERIEENADEQEDKDIEAEQDPEDMDVKEWYQHSLFSRLTEHFTRN